MSQKLVNPALRNIAGDGEQSIRFESDKSLLAHIAFDVLHTTCRRHQSIHARLRILSDLLDAPAVVILDVDPERRCSQHEKMRFTIGV